MKNLTSPQLAAILRYELYDVTIDDRKQMTFEVDEQRELFIVIYTWIDARTIGDGGVIFSEDNRENYFKILKSESLTKLREYILEMIVDVNENDFKEIEF